MEGISKTTIAIFAFPSALRLLFAIIDMAKKGIVKHTSEFFIYKYGQHLVKATTYEKIADLFNSNEQLLEVT